MNKENCKNTFYKIIEEFKEIDLCIFCSGTYDPKKEKEIITEELKNSGKDTKIVEKIAMGKLNKFIGENTLMNQEWIMEPKKKVKDVISEFAGKEKFIIKNFIRFKVGEGL